MQIGDVYGIFNLSVKLLLRQMEISAISVLIMILKKVNFFYHCTENKDEIYIDNTQ